MSPTPDDPSRPPAIKSAILKQMLADQAEGQLRTLEEYRALYPEHAELVEEIWEEVHQGPLQTSAAAIAGPSTAIPSSESRFEDLGELGRGGMGVIHRLRDNALLRTIVKKTILAREDGASPDHLHRFIEEAQVTGQLEHPGIVPVHDLATDEQGRPYFTMRLVKGRTLKEIFGLVRTEQDGWSRTRALEVIIKVCDTLAYAHSKGVIHRDLKPDNIMVGRYGQVYVMDWGLAKVVGREHAPDIRLPQPETTTRTIKSTRRELAEQTPDSPLVTMGGHVLGTPIYMSPEQAASKIEEMDARSDVYSIGAMIYELLGGEAPFVRSARDVWVLLHLKQTTDPPRLPDLAGDVPAELAAICEKAIARQQDQRYASMEELAEDLRAFREHRVVRAYRTGALIELRKWVERNRGLAAALAGAFVLLVAALIATLLFLEAERDRAEQAGQLARAERTFASVARLEDLRERAERVLWPIARTTVADMRAWLLEASDMRARLADTTAEAQKLRRLPADPVHGRTQQDRLEQLTQLESNLRAFLEGRDVSEGASGIWDTDLPSVERRVALAEDVACRSIEDLDARRAWEEAIAAIADPTGKYGFTLDPQEGLLPLGRDPHTGLREFAHLATGNPATRGAEGRLVRDEFTGLILVLVPGGRFLMGAQNEDPQGDNHDELAGPNEIPPNPVELEPFFISRYEMTQLQWRWVTGENPSKCRAGSTIGDREITLLNPVENVTWEDCQRVLTRLGLRLPTEAQWEYACRAGTSTPWWCDRAELVEAANVADEYYRTHGAPPEYDFEPWNDGHTTHAPVGSFAANPFGLHDVHGNVYEWCADWNCPYSGPTRRGDGLRKPEETRSIRPERMFRGGAWVYVSEHARSATRFHMDPARSENFIGVRPCRSIHHP